MQNTSKKTVRITAVKMNCSSCIVLDRQSIIGKTIRPGRGTTLELEALISKKKGKTQISAIVEANDGSTIKLGFRGDVTDTITWKPSRIELKNLDPDAPMKIKATLMVGSNDLKMATVSSTWPGLKGKVVSESDGEIVLELTRAGPHPRGMNTGESSVFLA